MQPMHGMPIQPMPMGGAMQSIVYPPGPPFPAGPINTFPPQHQPLQAGPATTVTTVQAPQMPQSMAQQKGGVRVLNGGEKADLNEQLPAGWTKPAHLGTVDLYQMGSSPPCAKLRMIFEFYGVNYKCWAGKKKDSEYQKVPVVVTNGLQINDSFIVVKSLAKILDGQPLTPQLLELEEMNTYGVMVALEAALANDCTELNKCGSIFADTINPAIACILPCVSCCVTAAVGPGFYKKNPHLLPLEQYREKYTQALQGKQYFHGSKPGVVDVSLCGVLAPFNAAGNMCVHQLLGRDGPVFEWYARMKAQLPTLVFNKSIESPQ